MTISYLGAGARASRPLGSWRAVRLLWLLLVLGTAITAQAQSGAYGNEWIVQSQPYYKVKVWRDGLYRLDYAYLSQLGAGAVAPTQLQVWRRGKEVAVYQGGNSATLDNTTYLEFFGQRNDGALDKEFYKNPLDQANPFYSFYTDTAAYFITWGTRAGKRMVQPQAVAGTPHGWRLQSSLVLKVGSYVEAPSEEGDTYLPWIEPGEGFFEGFLYRSTAASVDSLRAISTAAGAPAPRLETMVVGGSRVDNHSTTVSVVPPGSSTPRLLGTLLYSRFDHALGRYNILPSDISSTGSVGLVFAPGPLAPQFQVDVFRFSWFRVTAPQQNVWFSDRRQVIFQNDSLLSGPAIYEIDNIPATVAGFDIQDPWNVQRVAPATATTLGSTGRRFAFPSATGQQTRRLLLANEAQPLVPPPARRVNFRAIDPTRPNFVIITHPKLMQAAGSVSNVARAYAEYRASTAGGRYDTLMVTAPQLYDQFHYGERSVIALRHFALWMVARSPATQTKYLLLLGKGISPGTSVYTTTNPNFSTGFDGFNAALASRNFGENGLDLVPISTRSSSDIFLSSDWPHDNNTPAMPTGRVVAATPAEALIYLNKLKEYESQIDPNQLTPEPWHKSMLHLSGGRLSAVEVSTFRDFMDRYKRRAEHPLLGAQVTTIQREYNANSTLPLEVNIADKVNAGLALITYFGHGSTTTFDFTPGDITDPTKGYNNAKKYPIMMFNGCTVGAAFFNARTFATDWLLSQDKGAIGVMAESGLSFADLLDPAQDLTYQLQFNDPAWFGRPVAEIRREVIRRLQATPSFQPVTGNLRASEQLLCTIWQGDPALRMYAPAKPDFVASNAALSLVPIAPDAAVTTSSSQFTLSIGVSNPLRITRDSLEIRVTRTYPAATGLPPEVLVFNNYNGRKPFAQAFQRDTTYTITMTNPTSDFSGDNVFTVELDYRNKVAELNEANNRATLTYSFLRRGITLLTPTEFAIVPSTTPRLVIQNNNLNAAVRGYDFQVDSVASFDSPGRRESLNQQSGAIASWTPPALRSKGDSTVWYWRARLTTPVGTEDGAWQVGSFRVIPTATSSGWSQSHNGQFNRDQLAGVNVATPSNRWSFQAQRLGLALRTAGGGLPGSAPTFTASSFGVNGNGAVADVSNCGTKAPNLLLAVFDPRTLRQITVGGSFPACGPSGQPFYFFGADPTSAADTLDNLNNSAARRTQLVNFITRVPEGAYVTLVSVNRLRFADPNVAATMRQIATLLGSQQVASLQNGEPWALVAQKRAAGGTALAESGPDRTAATPYAQTLALNYTFSIAGSAGTITSTLIGPAQRWGTLFNVVKPVATTGSYKLALVGVDANNNTTVLNPDIKSKSLDLSGYSTATYPYMQLQLALNDSTNRTPPQLKQWLVTYKGLPEGVVRRDLVAAIKYDSATLRNQALTLGQLNFPVKFNSISTEAFASRLQVRAELVNASTNLPVKSVLLSAPRDLGTTSTTDTLTVNVSLDVRGQFGRFYVRAIVNPQLQPELYYFNNEVRSDVFVVRDTNLPPTLDVAVDGRHILDGELVSPRPFITMQLRDEDKVRLITDASFFTVYLQKDNGVPVPVDVNGSQMKFSVNNSSGSVARLDYQPGLTTPLADGTYTLRVQGRDASGRSAGTQDYQIKFVVVNASQISNVYPYPNPVTSKAKFVFTVTGQELPRNMKIQIMTLTGRVVREIFMSELGPLHIGNNVTDYAWDGTDQYGDRLANGTYLYRVALDDAGGDFKKFNTAGDRAFKNDWGKLVLLR